MARLMQQLAEHEGYCCVRELFRANKHRTEEDFAEHLGVSSRSIRDWKKKIREGTCTCLNLPTCAFREPA